MNYRFYVTDWQPNGTNNLVITNENGEVVEYVSEALFGVSVDFNTSELLVTDGHWVLCLDDQEQVEDVLNGDDPIFAPLMEISGFKAMHHIAISPVRDHSAVGSIIKRYMRLSA
jgi:hypothetical protein